MAYGLAVMFFLQDKGVSRMGHVIKGDQGCGAERLLSYGAIVLRVLSSEKSLMEIV